MSTKKEFSPLEEVVNKIKEELEVKNNAKHLIYIASRNLEIEKYLSHIDSMIETIDKYVKDNKVSDEVNELADEISNEEELRKIRDKFGLHESGVLSFNPYVYNVCTTGYGNITTSDYICAQTLK